MPYYEQDNSFQKYRQSALEKSEQSAQPKYTYHKENQWYPNPDYLGAGVGVAALFGSGYIPTTKGGRLFDYYNKGIRAVEEYSPGGVLRTFQISNILSQFESPGIKNLKVLPEDLVENKHYKNYLTQLIGGEDLGKTYARLGKEGVTLRDGSLFWGDSTDTALKYASRMTSPEDGSFGIGTGYARSLGYNLEAKNILKSADETQKLLITGGHSRLQTLGRQAGGLGTSYVTRFNNLLKQPFEMEPLKTIFEGINRGAQKISGNRIKRISFDVAESSGLKMLGALSLKYGLGFGALALGYKQLDYYARDADILNETILDEGITAGIATAGVKANILAAKVAEATGLQSYREAQEEIAPGSTEFSKLVAFPLLGGLLTSTAGYGAFTREMYKKQKEVNVPLDKARKLTTEQFQKFSQSETDNIAKAVRFISNKSGIYSREDMWGRFAKKVSTPDKSGDLVYKFIGKLTPTKLIGLAGLAAGATLVAPFLPGALIPSKTSDELKAIYSGEQEVAIRKGRWWEAGKSSWEGGRIMYYRQHWYPRMLQRGREKEIWNEEEGQEISPIEKFYKKEFTYDLEKMHYKDRPYPVSSLPFQDVPFVGPILSATLGRLIKPEVLMHTEEWMNKQGGAKVESPGFGQTLATDLGEQPHGLPVSPYSPTQVIGEQAYRMTEMIGLPGFAMTSVKEALTGTSDLFDQVRQLESARRISGIERQYWDLELGGVLGASESVRRLFPHRRRQIPLYNPIKNTMPDWIPGEGERGPNLQEGDPYAAIQEGEIRLPGKGYESRFPELKGVDPANYPLIHRYRILADVGPYTEKFKEAQSQIRAARKSKRWTDYEERMYQTTKAQLLEKRDRRKFKEYEYLPETGNILDSPKKYGADTSTGLMTALNKMHASAEKKPGVFTRLFGGYWEALSHNAELTVNNLTPLSPGSKLVHTRTAIEDYEKTKVFGTDNAFWSSPIRDFIAPAARMAAADLGYREIPEHIEKRRNLEEYFDVLKYVKYSRLANMARQDKDTKEVSEFEKKKNETLFGVNPYTLNYTSLYRSLPNRDRDYFSSFEKADTVEERERILELVPENQKALFAARWKLAFAQDLKNAKENDLLSDEQLVEADKLIEGIYDEARSEGFPESKELLAEYLKTRSAGESYPDWYRRTKILSHIPLPGADWIGWNSSVQLEDIKLKTVMNIGESMHDYNLWPSRLQAMANKPYINDEAVEPLLNPEKLPYEEIRDRIDSVMLANEVRPEVFLSTSWNGEDSIDIDVQQDIDFDPERLLK